MPRRHAIATIDFPPLQDGGIARWMDDVARGLCEAGREVSVLTRGRRRAAFEHDRAHPARVVRLPGHGWVRRHGFYLRSGRALLGPWLDGATVHAATVSVAHAILAPAPDRLLVYLHGTELLTAEGDSLLPVWNAAHVLVANSARVAAIAAERGAPKGRIQVVRPCTDPDRFDPHGPDLRAAWSIPAGAPVVLTLGRLVPRKGQDSLIRCWSRIREIVADAVLVVAGKGRDDARLRALARDCGMAESVRFAGFVPDADLPAAYRTADVFALPCREANDDFEGFGIVFLEAAATGKPVVAGRTGGVADAVLDGETGLLVPPDDDDALVALVAGLLAEPARARAMGTAGRARVTREFTRARMSEQILSLAE